MSTYSTSIALRLRLGTRRLRKPPKPKLCTGLVHVIRRQDTQVLHEKIITESKKDTIVFRTPTLPNTWVGSRNVGTDQVRFPTATGPDRPDRTVEKSIGSCQQQSIYYINTTHVAGDNHHENQRLSLAAELRTTVLFFFHSNSKTERLQQYCSTYNAPARKKHKNTNKHGLPGCVSDGWRPEAA